MTPAMVTGLVAGLVTGVATWLPVLVHAVHYLLVFGGLVVVAVMLGPQLMGRSHAEPDSPHARRVAQLRRAAASGMLAAPPHQATTHDEWNSLTRRLSETQVPDHEFEQSGLRLPVAVISTAAAAAVHAAVSPAHFAEGVLLGSFFVVSSAVQLGWTVAALRGTSRRLLQLGTLVNAGCIALWVLTRTVGLGATLLPEAEPVGPWDLAATIWETAAVLALLSLLIRGLVSVTVAPWSRWRPVARAWLVGSVVFLGALSVAGAGH